MFLSFEVLDALPWKANHRNLSFLQKTPSKESIWDACNDKQQCAVQ
jgi:hypothetical protein